MLLLLLACDPQATTDVDGGVWLGEASVEPEPFVSPPRAPEVGFLDPQAEQLFDVDDVVHVEVLAGDMDGSSLAELTLSWSSPGGQDLPSAPSVTGFASFDIEPLPVGAYTLSVEATDPAGLSTSASLNFYVALRDSDGDGFDNEALGGDDCDDADPLVNPDGAEVCDGVDQDCNGAVDDGVLLPFWGDADGDGFGDPATPTDACTAPAGYADNDGDCDDTTAARWPDNPEVCDGLDNDCDAEVDEGVKLPFWGDADGDGYGDSSVTASECSAPAGYVDNDADCLDTDPAVSPAETEVCYDGLDNDCDGTSNECGLGGDIDLALSDAQLRGEASGDYGGAAVSGAGDVDGDGLGELLVGAFGNDEAGSNAGAVYLVSGLVSGQNDLGSAARARVLGATAGDGFGWSVAQVGDWDGDGVADFAAGAYGYDGGGAEAGGVYVISGASTGDVSAGTGALLTLTGEDAGDYAGWSLGGGSDVDGDGEDDLLVGAPSADDGGSLSGAAWLVYGPRLGSLDLSGADARLLGEGASDQAGSSVALVGDQDGDGFADLAVGGIGDAVGGAGAGAAWLVHGPVSGDVSLSAADAAFIGELAGDQAGYAVAGGGDVDGDGRDDLLVGAPYHDYGAADAGATYLLLGGSHSGSTDLSSADAKLVGESGDDAAGWAVASAGDMDGDGFADVLVGGVLEDSSATDAGAAWLVYGPLSGFANLSAADGKFLGERAGDYAGNSLASVGDVSGDGKADVLLGAPYEDYGVGSRAGSAYLVLGQGL